MEVRELIDLLERFDAGKMAGVPTRKKGAAFSGSGLQMYSHGMWSYCGPDEVIGAYVDGMPLTDWLGWTGDKFDYRLVKVLTHYGPEGLQAGSVTSAVLAHECAEPNKVEWGKCEYGMCKGLMARCGEEVAAVNIGYGYCQEQPIYRVDGTLITNDAEWQAALASNVLAQDLETLLIIANKANVNQFDGLERLVKIGWTDDRTGSLCPNVDSIVVNWAYDGLAGAVNGHGSIINKIQDIIRRFKLRARGHGPIDFANDVVIMLPTFLRDCLVDYWAQAGGLLITGQVQIDATVMLERRDKFMTGGKFGDGWVPVDGTPISFLCNDYIPFDATNGNNCSDIYILTRRIGTVITLQGMFQDFSGAVAALAARFGADRFRVTDGGRFLVYQKTSNETCFNTCIIVRPGLYMAAPWLQARIHDVCCTPQFEPISKVPSSPYFLYGPEAQAYTTGLECYE